MMGVKKMEQIFLNEKCKFYARESKGTTPQMLYCNISVNGERIVISTGVKVIPDQFSAKKQRALISNDLTELNNRNNTIVNETISFYKTKFTDFILWLSQNPDKISECKQNLINFVPMKKKNNNNGNSGNGKKFSETLEYIFGAELEKEVAEHKITSARKEVKQSHLKIFYDFLAAEKLPQVWDVLTLQTFSAYADHLTARKLNISTLNGYLSTLKAVVNAVCDDPKNTRPAVDTKRWKLKEKQITNTEKKTSNYIFSDEQLNDIIKLELTGTAEIVRDIFVFGCYVGQRPADLVRLLNGEGERFVSNGIEVFSLLPHKTRKTDKVAFVPLFSDNIKLVDAIIERFKTNPDYKEFLNKTDKQRNALNAKWLKKIFADAGLTNTFEAKKQQGNNIETETKNQAETAHAYLSRHYFITYMCRHGVAENEVIEMTGHTSTDQIRATYSHLTTEQQADKFTSLASIQALAGNVPDSRMANTDDDLKQMLTEVLNKIDNNPDPVQLFLSMMPNLSKETKIEMLEKTAKKFNGDKNKAAIFLLQSLNLYSY